MKTDVLAFIKVALALVACALFFLVFTPVFAETSEETPKKLSIAEFDKDQDQGLLLKAISEQAMLPMFKEVKASSQTLLTKTSAFCGEQSQTSFIDLLNAWEEASVSWQQVDSLLFGPSVDDNIDFTVYFLPIKKGIIKRLLQSDTLLQSDVDSAGVGAQGFGALEYVLFSRESSSSDILKEFENDPKRCQYLMQATELLNENIVTISDQWEHYAVQFGLAGKNSLYFFESSEAMTLLINKVYQTAQKISVKKTALLSNEKEIKNSARYKLPAWRSGSTFMQVKSNVRGIKRILVDGLILEWMKKHKAKEAEEILHTIDQILSYKVADNDLFTALKSSPESLQGLVKSTEKLTELIKTELAPSLSVELGFNDNDGD